MKIRSGFVSNSSSSSFILVGVKFDKDSLLNNPEFKAQVEREVIAEQEVYDKEWETILNNPDYDKFKNLYDTCKSNNVSIPTEVSRFFGRGFRGVFEPRKPDEKSIVYEMLYEGRFKFPKGIELLTDDGSSYLGKIIATMSDDYFNNGSISIDDMKKYTEIMVELGYDEKDVKVYYGTRAC